MHFKRIYGFTVLEQEYETKKQWGGFDMVVGVLTLTLYIAEANSLKGKRRVLKSVIDKIKTKFNVSVAEVAKQDQWQLAVIGLSCVSNEQAHANGMLSTVIEFLERQTNMEILDMQMEFL